MNTRLISDLAEVDATLISEALLEPAVLDYRAWGVPFAWGMFDTIIQWISSLHQVSAVTQGGRIPATGCFGFS